MAGVRRHHCAGAFPFHRCRTRRCLPHPARPGRPSSLGGDAWRRRPVRRRLAPTEQRKPTHRPRSIVGHAHGSSPAGAPGRGQACLNQPVRQGWHIPFKCRRGDTGRWQRVTITAPVAWTGEACLAPTGWRTMHRPCTIAGCGYHIA